ncbi:hypothetical protein IE53DRAFT_386455 [Violaceomyces palustris]|uniref:Uncharacterized protein n=1 Tax=Violaceomyces palustris TaxID=1673888 RepID=A0ACD0NZI5_9BASI|nr:hypothetical protein IE53DRAFT_386455 [Violaceomyces palustris]
MSKLSVYLPIFATFLFFLRWNGGIVLGDKANHVAALHLPQLFYFVTFSTFFAWPALLATVRGGSPLRLLTRSLRGLFGTFPRAITTLCLLGLMLAAIDAFTIEHPFLLADNRHYTFYLWRRVVKAHPLAKFALAPVYLLCGRLWIDALGRTQSLFWMLGFVLATCLTLVPSPLLEPRYFIVPFVIMRAHLVPYQALVDEVSDCREEAKVGGKMGKEEEQEEEDGWMKWNHVLLLMIEGLWYAAINAVTMYVFLNKPFKWPSEEGWQRFMW